MSTSKETINKDQPGDSPVEMCQTKMPKPITKRKLVSELCTPAKQCRLVDEKAANPDNCHMCSKKLKFISAFECRCGKFFCNRHRFFDQHNCPFDYKTEAIARLKESNPKVIAKKLGE